MVGKGQGILYRSISLPGLDGGTLMFSETLDRKSIEVTLTSDVGDPQVVACGVRLNKAQFEALCNLNSTYDGLMVIEDEGEAQPQAGEPPAVMEI